MNIGPSDIQFCESYLGRRFRRFLPPAKRTYGGLNHSQRLIHSAINSRANMTRDPWLNTRSLLQLVRKNIATGSHKEHGSMAEYMQAHAYGPRCDETRAKYYRRLLLRLITSKRFPA